VDPATIRSRDLDDIRPGGLGVHIIHEVMDEVRYERRDSRGMRLTMVKQRRSPEVCGTEDAHG
jgi:anti-sigma regulatory factor (Ser/Thr protein kinase)